MKVGTIGLLAVGILFTMPVLENEAVTKFASSGKGPVFAGPLFLFVFIIIACGALSGFHALIASGTTPKLIEKESQVRMVGYGAMLTESFVAVMAMIAASILDQGLYFAMNSPPGVVGATVQSASEAVTNLGFTITPDQLQAAAQQVEEQTRSPAPAASTLAVGMSTIFSGAFGGDALKAFWYHFAIMFEALFILTTVDAGTRVGRFMLQDTIGNVWKPMARPRGGPASMRPAPSWSGRGVLPVGRGHRPARRHQPAVPAVRDRQSAAGSGRPDGRHHHPDQVGAGEVGLGDRRPLAWDAAVTLSASWYKIFSSDPLIGFFAQRDKYQQALDAAKVIPPAKSLDDVAQIVTNSTVDGVLRSCSPP